MYLIICFPVAFEDMSFRKVFLAINIARSYKAPISTALGNQLTLVRDYCLRVNAREALLNLSAYDSHYISDRGFDLWINYHVGKLLGTMFVEELLKEASMLASPKQYS